MADHRRSGLRASHQDVQVADRPLTDDLRGGVTQFPHCKVTLSPLKLVFCREALGVPIRTSPASFSTVVSQFGDMVVAEDDVFLKIFY